MTVRQAKRSFLFHLSKFQIVRKECRTILKFYRVKFLLFYSQVSLLPGKVEKAVPTRDMILPDIATLILLLRLSATHLAAN